MAGGVLTIIGGFFILSIGAVVAYIVGLFGGFRFGGLISSFLVLGPILGLIIIILGILALVLPDLNVAWGALVIILSVLSIFSSAIGGLFLGFLLALIGGILILVKRAPPPVAPWTPAPPPMSPPMAPPPPP